MSSSFISSTRNNNWSLIVDILLLSLLLISLATESRYIVIPQGDSSLQGGSALLSSSSSSNFSSSITENNFSEPLVLPKSATLRIVQARVYFGDKWTLPSEDAVKVGLALAELKPTYVASLIDVQYNVKFTAQEVSDYNTIRKLVLESSPHALFDAFLSATQFNTSSEVLSTMKYVNSQIHVDIWFFDYYSFMYNHFANKRLMLEAAIRYAHSQGQYIGGNAWSSFVPPGSDFIATNDVLFGAPYKLVMSLEKSGLPVLIHLNNNPQNNGTYNHKQNIGPWAECCYFMQKFNEKQRAQFVTALAKNQSWGYHLMFAVAFPTCPIGRSYDSLKDGNMLATINELMGLTQAALVLKVLPSSGSEHISQQNYFTVNYVLNGRSEETHFSSATNFVYTDPYTLVTISGQTSLSNSSEIWCFESDCSDFDFISPGLAVLTSNPLFKGNSLLAVPLYYYDLIRGPQSQ